MHILLYFLKQKKNACYESYVLQFSWVYSALMQSCTWKSFDLQEFRVLEAVLILGNGDNVQF